MPIYCRCLAPFSAFRVGRRRQPLLGTKVRIAVQLGSARRGEVRSRRQPRSRTIVSSSIAQLPFPTFVRSEEKLVRAPVAGRYGKRGQQAKSAIFGSRAADEERVLLRVFYRPAPTVPGCARAAVPGLTLSVNSGDRQIRRFRASKDPGAND